MISLKQNDGFTLIEMLVTLCLMALLLIVSLPYATSSGEARKLDAASQIIAAKLRDTQAAALSSNRERSITIDLKSGFLIQTDPDRTFKIPDGIAMQILTVTNETVQNSGAFRFFPDGGSTGGKIILTKNDLHREIAISWLTGAVVSSSGGMP